MKADIIYRLTDNYEDKGDFIQEFYELQELIVDACSRYPYRERIVELARNNGVIGEQEEALDFVRLLMDAPIPHIAIENPISVISSKIRKPDQIIQPWQFGHGETKATCLWLKGLPKLEYTNVVEGREARVHKMPPSADRWKKRSETYQGIADAMAKQWSDYVCLNG